MTGVQTCALPIFYFFHETSKQVAHGPPQLNFVRVVLSGYSGIGQVIVLLFSVLFRKLVHHIPCTSALAVETKEAMSCRPIH